MKVYQSLFAHFATILLSSTILLPAELIVGPARPINFRVNVNRIQTISSDGEAATVFGNASQEADIIAGINRIWAQAGIEISFGPVRQFVSDFAFDDNGQSNGGRPGSDLGQMLTGSGSITRFSQVDIDMFFVRVVPGFGLRSANSAAGLAMVDRPGTAVYVGRNLLGFGNGRDVIASVMAHEIGHNLGLNHTASNGPNLMSPGNTTENLTSGQRNIVFTDQDGFRGAPLIDGFELIMPIDSESNFENFVESNSLSGTLDADADSDGVPDLIEFATGLDPRSPDSLPELVLGGDAATWTIPKAPEAVEDGVIFQVAVSNDLRNFVPAGRNGSQSEVLNNGNSQISVRLNRQGSQFASLNVELAQTLASFQTLEAEEPIDPNACNCCGNCGVRTAYEFGEPAE